MYHVAWEWRWVMGGRGEGQEAQEEEGEGGSSGGVVEYIDWGAGIICN